MVIHDKNNSRTFLFAGAGGCGQWVIIQIIIHNDIYNYKVIVKVSK